MALFVLVPGAWHGAWCWAGLTPWLQKAGHRVFTPDLAAVPPGANPLPVWAAHLAELLQTTSEPAILLGHSRGGMVINEAVALAAGRIRALVYLAAFSLPQGESLQSAMAWPEAGGPATYLRPARGRCLAVAPEVVIPRFYPLAPRHLAEAAAARLHPEPLGAFAALATVTMRQLDSVPRFYIECRDDLVIPLSLQRAMQAALPGAKVLTMNADHSPFLSMPDQLASLLGTIAMSIA